MNPIFEEFIARARGVSFAAACDILAVPQPGGASAATGKKRAKSRTEYQGPCPRCGGDDRFSVNRGKGVWNCRGTCGHGGRDGIGLAGHMLHLDLRGLPGLLQACSAILREPVPDGAQQESEEDRAARELRIAEAEKTAAQQRDQREERANLEREKEIRKARGMVLEAQDCLAETPSAQVGRDMVRAYLKARTGFFVPDGFFEHARFRLSAGYYHGHDDSGRTLCIYSGATMILPIVSADARIIGCHQTWIALDCPDGKYRPLLYARTKAGVDAGRSTLEDGGIRRPPSTEDIAAGLYERLPTKKMRGSKKGGILPLIGSPDLVRWVGGEGIENIVAFAGAECFREDTFYFTSGDLGNLAGQRDPSSDFFHPSLTAADKNGRHRRVKVQGPVPRPDQQPGEAMPVAYHVRELVLAADGDSEPFMTAAAMARAEARLARPGLEIATAWPPAGTDFSSALSAAMNKGEV